MTRLYHQLYLTIFGGLMFVVLAAGAIWQWNGGRKWHGEQIFEQALELDSRGLLSTEQNPSARREFLESIRATYGADVALVGADRRLIDFAGHPPATWRGEVGSAQLYRVNAPALGIRLRDGGWIEVRPVSPVPPVIFLKKMGIEALVGVIIAVLCYPVVRHLTRRLERLQRSVESLGSGDLTARVKVEGRDEVARLAQSFNAAAAQIETLVEAHKLLLANVSHELRTPLSRLRLTAELLKEVADPKRKADLQKDVTEIDALIEKILLSSRLDAVRDLEVCEQVDLLALAAEEGARCAEFGIGGEAVIVRGDPGLLQRMIRNLIENAQQHGSPPVAVSVGRRGKDAVLMVSDGGFGIPEAERERVFAPFYRAKGTRSPGSGLGLGLVRQIARQHGGEAVWAGSASCLSAVEVILPADCPPCTTKAK